MASDSGISSPNVENDGHRIGICLLADDLGPDAGTERQVADTVAGLDPTRFDVHVCCFSDSARLRALGQCASTAVFPLCSVFSIQGIRQLLRFRAYVARHRIRVVHAFMVRTAIFGVLAGIQGRCAIVTSRLNTGYWYTPFYVRLFRLLNRCTDSVFANSEEAKRVAVAVEGLPKNKVTVIYNGVDMVRYATGNRESGLAASLGIPPDARVVGIVSNLRPVKDVALFLRAAAVVTSRVQKVAFLIVGQGSLRDELGLLASQLGLDGKVFFSDGRGNVSDWLARMWVACLSSQGEGFSNAVLEYMAAGLPVVATHVGGNPEAIVDGVTGYLVRERRPEAFAAPIIALLDSEEKRAAMGRNARERCREHFQMERYWSDMQEFYRTLTHGT